MSALINDQVNGRTIRVLGVSAPVNLNVNANTPICIIGNVQNQAPDDKIGVIQFVQIACNNEVGATPTFTFRLGNLATINTAGDFVNNIVSTTTYPLNPSLIYLPDQLAPYGAGVTFAVRITGVAPAGNTAVFTAYGWTA